MMMSESSHLHQNGGKQHLQPPASCSPIPNATGGNTPTISAPTQQPKQYGRVEISLVNPILPPEMLEQTPSRVDGLDEEVELALRITGCRLIQLSGTLLRLPQTAMATAQVLFQRYYYSKSFVRFPMEFTCMACVVLASKVEEAPRRVRDVLNVFNNIKQIRIGEPQTPLVLNENYIALKNQVIKMERRILKELGFCVHVQHPHKFIITIANSLNIREHTEIIQSAWNYMNDSLQTDVFVRYSPEAVACACLHLSLRILRINVDRWHLVYRMEEDTLNDICRRIMVIYTRELPEQEVLEEKVSQARKLVDVARAKAKEKALLESNKLDENTTDSLDSKTNSPNVLSSGLTTKSDSSSLVNLSVINRLKQQLSDKKLATEKDETPPLSSAGGLKSTVVMEQKEDSSNERNDRNAKVSGNETDSRLSTPEAFKLEKSPTSERGERRPYSSSSDYSKENYRRQRRRHDYDYDRDEDERYESHSRRHSRHHSKDRYREGKHYKHYRL